MVYSKNDFNLTKLFVLRLFNTVGNLTEFSRFELKTFIKFSVSDKCKSCEIYNMYDVYREPCFSYEIFTSGLNIGFLLRPCVEKQFMMWKYSDFAVKKQFYAQQSIKKIILTIFCEIKESIRINCLKKGATV